MQYVILIIVVIAIVGVIIENIGAILLVLLAIAGGALALGAFCWFCWWLWTLTPWHKKHAEEARQAAIEYEKIRLEMEKENEREAENRRKAERIRVGKILEWLKAYMIIVDTNVFMDAAEDSNTSPEMVAMSNWLFGNIGAHGIKLHILVSQLNELAHINKGDDEKKKYKARSAQRVIECLQDKHLVDLLGDPTARERYADVEIIKVARRLSRENRRPLVITNDRDLKIRVNSVEGATCIAMPELYNKSL